MSDDMPKRRRSSSAPSRSTRRRPSSFRKRFTRKTFRKTKRSVASKYLFHRWITALGASYRSQAGGNYDGALSTFTVAQNVSTASLSMGFQFSDIPNTSEFTALFDQYKLAGVKVQIKLINNPNSDWAPNSGGHTVGTTQFGNYYPTVWSTTDFDDANTVTLSQIKEFGAVKHRVCQPNRELNYFIKPKTLSAVYRSGVSNAYATGRSQYLDMSNTDVPHYGMKFVFDLEGLQTNAVVEGNRNFSFKLNFKYYFACKNVR